MLPGALSGTSTFLPQTGRVHPRLNRSLLTYAVPSLDYPIFKVDIQIAVDFSSELGPGAVDRESLLGAAILLQADFRGGARVHAYGYQYLPVLAELSWTVSSRYRLRPTAGTGLMKGR